MSPAAQDEYDTLAAMNRPRTSQHPEDSNNNSDSESSAGSTTLAPSTIAPTTASTTTHRSNDFYTNTTNLRSGTSRFPYNDEDDEDDEDEESSRLKPSTYYLPREYDADAMTGPKGVIADAQALEKEKRGGHKDEGNFDRTRDLALPRTQWSLSPSPGRGTSKKKDSSWLGEDPDEEAEANEDEEDEEVRKWREKRMGELRVPGDRELNGYKNRRKQRRFGSVEVVDGMGYLEAVDTASRGAVVAVFIYNDEVRLPFPFLWTMHLILAPTSTRLIFYVPLHWNLFGCYAPLSALRTLSFCSI